MNPSRIVKSKSDLMAMSNPQLINYLDNLDVDLFKGFVDADTKVRYFVAKYGEGIARAIKGTNLFFPAVVAQSITESGYGRSELTSKANNFGGIKYNPKIHSGYIFADTTEFLNGKRVKITARFAKFTDVAEGFKSHVNVLMADRYKNARNLAKTPEEQITMFAKAGYTTTPPKEYLDTMRGNIKRVRDKYKISKIV
jgi:flagellum-specific peptidoglycan hydrolase FlgJ